MNAAGLVTTLATALGQVFDMLMHLGSALMLGALIGLERQWSHHPAGLKTNVLVSLGAASFCLFALNAEGPVGAGRVGAQIVSGIGFLGGGVILREGFNIRGLNTAATLWCSAAVGALSGGGQFLLAAVAATLIVGTNIVLLPIATVMNRTAAKRTHESLH